MRVSALTTCPRRPRSVRLAPECRASWSRWSGAAPKWRRWTPRWRRRGAGSPRSRWSASRGSARPACSRSCEARADAGGLRRAHRRRRRARAQPPVRRPRRALDLEVGDAPLDGAVRALLEEQTQPLALVLDDVHWADEATLELTRRAAARPARRAGAARARDAPAAGARGVRAPHRPPRADAGRGARADRRARRRHLSRSPAATRSTCSCSPAPPRRSSRGPAVRLSGVEVPRATAAAFAREIAQLSDNARQVLAGASVAGDPFSTDLAAVAAGVSDWAALEAIDELLRSGLVPPLRGRRVACASSTRSSAPRSTPPRSATGAPPPTSAWPAR